MGEARVWGFLVHTGDGVHLLLGQGETEDVEVGAQPLLVGGFGDQGCAALNEPCLLYTSDAADHRISVYPGGSRPLK